jgi:hypothetical protein
MAQPHRPERHPLFAVSVVLAVAWVGLARWVVPPLLAAQSPGPARAAVQHYLQGNATPFTSTDLLGLSTEFSVAVSIATILHLTILLILSRYDLRATGGRSPANGRGGRGVSRALAILALAFLAVTVLTGACHDYYFYLQMWYEVRQAHDPWWMVQGRHGPGPLNAYGPAFNLLAGLSWLNPLAPKLLFAYGYIIFTVVMIKKATAHRRLSGLESLGLFVLFWNPFPWIEIALRGHFDILVGLFCLAALHARIRGREILSGVCLALGVLLKYFPLALLPFLALDRGRLRLRSPVVALAVIALGMALSSALWGPSVLRPLVFAAIRPSTTLSIFRFFRTLYAALIWPGIASNHDDLSPVLLVLGLLLAWSWSRARRPSLEASAAIAAMTTVLLYRVGLPQYHMVPLVLASSWALWNWGQLTGRALLGIALGGYVAWLATFDVGNLVFGDDPANPTWAMIHECAGLPTFLLGCLFLSAMVRSSAPEGQVVIPRLGDLPNPTSPRPG